MTVTVIYININIKIYISENKITRKWMYTTNWFHLDFYNVIQEYY